MTAQTLSPTRLRLPAILLVFSLLGFMAVIAVTLTIVLPSFPKGLDPATPQQLTQFQFEYILGQALILLAVMPSISGIALLANTLKETHARRWAWIAFASALATIGLYAVIVSIRLSVLGGFTEPTLVENNAWQWSSWAFTELADPATAFTTLIACIALFFSGILKRTGLIVGLLSAVLLILAIVAEYIPAVYIFLWVPLGVALLRRK